MAKNGKRTCEVADDSAVEAGNEDAEEGSGKEKGRVCEEDGEVLVAP